MSDPQKSRRGGSYPGNPSGLRGRPTKAAPGTIHLRLDSNYPLPCAIRADTPSGICGKPALALAAWQQEPSGSWPTPGLWTVQPVCRECAIAAAEAYHQ